MQAYRSTFAFWRPTPRQRRRGWRSQGVIGANVDIGAFELDIADVLLADGFDQAQGHALRHIWERRAAI